MEFSSFRYLPLRIFSCSAFPLNAIPSDFSHWISSLRMLPTWASSFRVSPFWLLRFQWSFSGCHSLWYAPFGFYPSGVFLLGLRPSLYLHLIIAFYFCKMGYFTKKRPVFPTKHQWKFPPLLCYNKNVGRIAKCAQQKRLH